MARIRIRRLYYMGSAFMFMLGIYSFFHNKPAARNEQHEMLPHVLSKRLESDFAKAMSNTLGDTERRSKTNKNSDLLPILEKFRQSNKPALVTVINDAYMPFAHSWLCNTMYMDIHEQVLLITTDEKSQNELGATWPNIQVIGMSGEGFHGNQNYSHAGYVRIMVKRTELILQILEHKVEMLLFELDSFWKTDPMPLIMKAIKGYDIAGLPVSNQHSILSGGFIYMKPTERTIKLWRRLTDMMLDVAKRIKSLKDDKKISEGQNDQVFISSLLRRKYAGIKVTLLSIKDFPDGVWYFRNETVRQLPYLVVQNTWVIGNNNKIKRAIEFKHWFWDSNNRLCDTALVKQQTIG